MIKKIIRVMLLSFIIASATYASPIDDKYYSRSLVGFEGSYSSFEVKDTSTTIKKESFGVAGIKIGAETSNVRMFLSAKNAFIGDENYEYTSAFMYGVELQYMFNINEITNFYIGANIGKINLEFYDLNENKRVYNTLYKGGDVGFNIHLDDSLDLELGGRFMTLDDSQHTLNTVTYTFDDIVTGYVSLIFKYQMD